MTIHDSPLPALQMFLDVARSQAVLLFPLSLLALSSLFVLSIKRRQRFKEVVILKEVLRAVLKRSPYPTQIRFTHPELQSLYHTIQSIGVSQINQGASQKTYEEVLSLSSRITEATDDCENVIREAIQLVLAQGRPEILAAAVILTNESDKSLSLAHCVGIPTARVKDSLLSHFDSVFNAATDEARWGYYSPRRGDVLDFSTFHVGGQLITALRTEHGLSGALWIGFREGVSSLSPQRKLFLEAITQHAAASFYAARQTHSKTTQSNKERDYLLGISHDLRAPGNTALYALRELLSGEVGPLSTEQHLLLQGIEHALEHQLSLLGDVLDFAKHQKGFLTAQRQATRLEHTIRKVCKMYQVLLTNNRLSFICSPIPEVTLDVDPRHLERILSNFLSNALKYTEHGEIRLGFNIAHNNLEITVSDTGFGIPESEQSNLFQEFHRLPDARARKQAGIGLGLALCKALAELNNGYVFHRPNYPEGSHFGVGLELLKPHGNDVEPTLQQHFGTILVVDDDRATCRMSCRYLRDICRTVVPASSYGEALRLVDELKPDLIVSDMHLQDRSAEMLATELYQQGIQTPILIMTGSSEQLMFEELREMNIFGVLEKPFTREALLQLIQRKLERDKKAVSKASSNASSIISSHTNDQADFFAN